MRTSFLSLRHRLASLLHRLARWIDPPPRLTRPGLFDHMRLIRDEAVPRGTIYLINPEAFTLFNKTEEL